MISDDLGNIASRLEEVRRRIARAAARAGRAPEEIRLIAVSKGKPAEAIRAAYTAGQRDFGENYVQELAEKAEALADLDGLVWHAIGHLQRNKAKVVARVAQVVQSVDREEIVVELDRRAAALARTLDVLLEVNVGGEATKSGCAPGDLGPLLAAVARCAHLRPVGLMTIAPFREDPADVRPFFAQLRALRDAHGGQAALPALSMGMSHDLEAAIAEGATLVRVGTAIFGARDPR
ncbi:YggS family pyridoxal phosphate-dependent enzyme [Sorangium cellulosum]|uniref:YggS family pyridoxal phosphate-dependent enzyme n=1 Tax=Sorangium cellulosum TaxID=56 RepID=UPI0010132853|nr:YggS family pyridoxal phosphate-dependent enzyme [Sorangium cellulosum]